MTTKRFDDKSETGPARENNPGSPQRHLLPSLRYLVAAVLLLVSLYLCFYLLYNGLINFWLNAIIGEASNLGLRDGESFFKVLKDSDRVSDLAYSKSAAAVLIFMLGWVPSFMASLIGRERLISGKAIYLASGCGCGFIVSDLLLIGLVSANSDSRVLSYLMRIDLIVVGGFFALLLEETRGQFQFSRHTLGRITSYSLAVGVIDTMANIFMQRQDSVGNYLVPGVASILTASMFFLLSLLLMRVFALSDVLSPLRVEQSTGQST